MHPSVTPMIIAPYIAKWILQMKLTLTSGCQGEYLGRSSLAHPLQAERFLRLVAEVREIQSTREIGGGGGGCVEGPEESL